MGTGRDLIDLERYKNWTPYDTYLTQAGARSVVMGGTSADQSRILSGIVENWGGSVVVFDPDSLVSDRALTKSRTHGDTGWPQSFTTRLWWKFIEASKFETAIESLYQREWNKDRYFADTACSGRQILLVNAAIRKTPLTHRKVPWMFLTGRWFYPCFSDKDPSEVGLWAAKAKSVGMDLLCWNDWLLSEASRPGYELRCNIDVPSREDREEQRWFFSLHDEKGKEHFWVHTKATEWQRFSVPTFPDSSRSFRIELPRDCLTKEEIRLVSQLFLEPGWRPGVYSPDRKEGDPVGPVCSHCGKTKGLIFDLKEIGLGGGEHLCVGECFPPEKVTHQTMGWLLDEAEKLEEYRDMQPTTAQ